MRTMPISSSQFSTAKAVAASRAISRPSNVVPFDNSKGLGQRLAGSGALVFEGELASPFSAWKPARKAG